MNESEEENLHTIQNLHNLIGPHVQGICDQSRIVAVKQSRLRYADQYGSILLKLSIELVNIATGEDWTLSAVAKTLPKYSGVRDIFRIQAIFKNEIGIYGTARRVIDGFLREKGVKTGADFFIQTFGGRLNLNGSTDIDRNAVLILRDYKSMGYKIVHRRTGFDFDTTKAILKTLAKFHGSALALKIQEPKKFRDKIRPYLGQFFVMPAWEQTARSHLISTLKNEGFSPGTIDVAVAAFNRRCSREIREPWATFTHSNVWIRNILVKFDLSKQVPDVKLKGFQESEYASPLRDVLFFLFSSVQLAVLRQHLDELLEFYFSNLLANLKNLDVDDLKQFSKSSFSEELRAAASKGGFYKIVCMLYPVLNIENEFITDLNDSLHINRLCYLVQEFEKRHWLRA